MEEVQKIVTVGSVTVMKHGTISCRHCGEEYEGACCHALPRCPHCGCPTDKPINHESKKILDDRSTRM